MKCSSKPEALTIVTQDFNRRAPAVAKDIDRAAQGILAQNPTAHATEPINPLAKIDRLSGQKNTALRRQL